MGASEWIALMALLAAVVLGGVQVMAMRFSGNGGRNGSGVMQAVGKDRRNERDQLWEWMDRLTKALDIERERGDRCAESMNALHDELVRTNLRLDDCLGLRAAQPTPTAIDLGPTIAS